jgi:large subunit ribosomal protein L14e
VFTRFVEVGRVALVQGGEDNGKLVVIVDVIDQARALCDGPSTGVRRKAIAFSLLRLTDFKIAIQHSMRSGKVKKAFDEAKVLEKWHATAWAQRLARRQRRATLTDFERFKVRPARGCALDGALASPPRRAGALSASPVRARARAERR